MVDRRKRKPKDPIAFDGEKTALKLNPDWTMRLDSGRHHFRHVRVRIGRPLYRPEEFATVLEAKHDWEIGHIVNLPGLNRPSREALEEHGRKANLTTPIVRVHKLVHQLGSSYWDVETGKGRRQFVIRGTTEHIRWLADERLLITDVRGNRFEIRDMKQLDQRSQTMIGLIL